MKKIIIFCFLACFFLHGPAFGSFNFIDNNNGTVTDARTGLIWMKDANAIGLMEGSDTSVFCASLADGQAGLTDGSTAGQWRVPSIEELEGIGTDPPAAWNTNPPPVIWTMPGTPFTNVQSGSYWSITRDAYFRDCMYLTMSDGTVGYGAVVGEWCFVWPVRDGVSTIIELASFYATPKAGKVILNWSTESEIDNAGFNLYRADAENGDYTKINPSLIPAKGSSTQGAFYEFIDSDVKNRKAYYYKLEDIDLNGTSTMHGPVSATPRLIYGLSNSAGK